MTDLFEHQQNLEWLRLQRAYRFAPKGLKEKRWAELRAFTATMMRRRAA